jgi:hypothetical protein
MEIWDRLLKKAGNFEIGRRKSQIQNHEILNWTNRRKTTPAYRPPLLALMQGGEAEGGVNILG